MKQVHGRILFCFLIIVSAILKIVTITFKVWHSKNIWNADYCNYSTSPYAIAGIMIIVSLVVHGLILLNMLLTLPPDRPVQGTVAMTRSSMMALFTTCETVACIVTISIRGCVSSPVGFILLGSSVGIS
ncbi:hypothetical protein FO519_005226, partial [Halicephalobus sp. NKZ332]